MKSALSMTVVFMNVSMVLGGYYTTTIPTWLEWSKYVSHMTYAYNILLRIEFEHAASSFYVCICYSFRCFYQFVDVITYLVTKQKFTDLFAIDYFLF